MSKGGDALAIALTTSACMAMLLLRLDPIVWAPLLAAGLAYDVRGMLAEGRLREHGPRFVLGILVVTSIALTTLMMLGGWVGTRAMIEIAIVCAIALILLELGSGALLKRMPDLTVR